MKLSRRCGVRKPPHMQAGLLLCGGLHAGARAGACTGCAVRACTMSTGAFEIGPVHRCCSRSRACARSAPGPRSPRRARRPLRAQRLAARALPARARTRTRLAVTERADATAAGRSPPARARVRVSAPAAAQTPRRRTCSSTPRCSRAAPRTSAACARRSSRRPAARSPSTPAWPPARAPAASAPPRRGRKPPGPPARAERPGRLACRRMPDQYRTQERPQRAGSRALAWRRGAGRLRTCAACAGAPRRACRSVTQASPGGRMKTPFSAASQTGSAPNASSSRPCARGPRVRPGPRRRRRATRPGQPAEASQARLLGCEALRPDRDPWPWPPRTRPCPHNVRSRQRARAPCRCR